MSDTRPTVASDLVASLITGAPERVRTRLDRAPNAAEEWTWQSGSSHWTIQAGAETVTMPQGHLSAVEQVTCTCLLTPRCFHVLACLMRLTVAFAEKGAEDDAVPESEPTEDSGDNLPIDENQRRAAHEMVGSLSQLLQSGAANAGVFVQSALLRAIHQCRADGLYRLASLGLRTIAGVNDIRGRTLAADPTQFAEDLADALETARHVLGARSVARYWIGAARREQLPVRPRKLHGLFAEPILTKSGFAGAAAYFLGEDDHVYSASDVRPGDAQRAIDAYLGGIEIGPLVQPARQLSRGLYLGSDLTASLEGRLGRGKNIKIVEQGTSTWNADAFQKRFQRPLTEQWNAVFANAVLPADARPGGWDFVFVKGAVLGAAGPELLFQIDSKRTPVRLAIANEAAPLKFRENLRMLAHAPGLRLQVIARINVQDPHVLLALAVAPSSDAAEEKTPRLAPPETLAGRVFLGFDEIKRSWLIGAQASAFVIADNAALAPPPNPLDLLQRRWIAAMLSGANQGRQSNSTLQSEAASLHRTGFATAAGLLELLTRVQPNWIDSFLATAIYLRHSRCELARFMASQE